MKRYVLFHANCPDGAGAAWAAWRAMGEQDVHYIPVNYGQPVPEMEPDSEVYILDFSYPAEALWKIAERSRRLHVEDHHATAKRDLAGLEVEMRTKLGKPHTIHFDMEKSGAMLAWDHFHPDIVPPLILEYIQDRDLWAWKLPFSREVSAALAMINIIEDFKRLSLAEANDMEGLKNDGILLLRFKEQQVDIMARNHRMALFDMTGTPQIIFGSDKTTPFHNEKTHCVPVANASVFFSEVGERLLEMYPDAKFAAYYFDRAKDNVRQWGIRARPGFDAATLIAKPFGGGGHPAACGWTTPL